MVGEEGQSAITHSGDWEYPLNGAVPPPPGLKPFDSPRTAQGRARPTSATAASRVELMQEVGLL